MYRTRENCCTTRFCLVTPLVEPWKLGQKPDKNSSSHLIITNTARDLCFRLCGLWICKVHWISTCHSIFLSHFGYLAVKTVNKLSFISQNDKITYFINPSADFTRRVPTKVIIKCNLQAWPVKKLAIDKCQYCHLHVKMPDYIQIWLITVQRWKSPH